MALQQTVEYVNIDGSTLEGGGQILRVALASSLLTQIPTRIENIRGNRPVPGLSKQHLEVVRACEQLGGTVEEEYVVGTKTITFRPTNKDLVDLSELHINVNSAGSITLILQAIVPVLALRGKQPIDIYLRGGTDVSFSPSIDFLNMVLSKYLHRMDLSIAIIVTHRGFYPRGMTDKSVPVHVRITPVSILHGLRVQNTAEFGPLISNVVTKSSMTLDIFSDSCESIYKSHPNLALSSIMEDTFFQVPEYKDKVLTFGSQNIKYPIKPNGPILNNNTHHQYKKNDTELHHNGLFQGAVEPILEARHKLETQVNEQYVDTHSANQVLIFGFMAYLTSGEITSFRFNLRTNQQIEMNTNDLHFITALDILKRFYPLIPYQYSEISPNIGEIIIGEST